MDLFCRSSARSSASMILLPTAPTPSSARSAFHSTAETTYISSRPAMAPPDEEKQPLVYRAHGWNPKLLLASCCLQFSTVSASLAIGYVIGTAVAPELLTRRTYTGGITWIVLSLVVAVASGVWAFVLWKRLRSNTSSPTVHEQSEKITFRTNIDRSPSRRTSAGEGFEMRLLNSISKGPRETLNKTPIAPVPEASAGDENKRNYPDPRSQIRTDPATYFRNRPTSEEKPNLMPPKIDSSFWRALTPLTSLTPNVPNEVDEPHTPTRRPRSSISSRIPKSSSHRMSTEALSDNLTVVYRPRTVVRDSGIDSSLLQNDASRASISLPKRVSSLGAPTTLTSSPPIHQSDTDMDSVPNFSVPRTPSRPVSTILLDEGSNSPSVGPRVELNDNSYAIDQSDMGQIRPDSTTLPGPPSLAIARSASDYEPFPYDRSGYCAGNTDPVAAPATPESSDHVDGTHATVVPYALNSSTSMSTLKPQSSPASPVSSFEPSLYSSQISLRMTNPPSATAAHQSETIDEDSPTRRPSMNRASSQKTSTDRLSFKSARTTLHDDFDDAGNIKLRLWSRTSMYEGA